MITVHDYTRETQKSRKHRVNTVTGVEHQSQTLKPGKDQLTLFFFSADISVNVLSS